VRIPSWSMRSLCRAGAPSPKTRPSTNNASIAGGYVRVREDFADLKSMATEQGRQQDDEDQDEGSPPSSSVATELNDVRDSTKL
jgi:hypothetical protein